MVDATTHNSVMSQTAKKSRDIWSDPLLTVEETSEYLKIPVKTLYQWKYKNVGPQPLRVGRYLRYRQSEVDAWVDAGGSR